jgi:hypothetical protein
MGLDIGDLTRLAQEYAWAEADIKRTGKVWREAEAVFEAAKKLAVEAEKRRTAAHVALHDYLSRAADQ